MLRPKATQRRVVDGGYTEIHASVWEEAFEELRTFSAHWLFRGHRNATWVLTSSLQREKFHVGLEAVEARMLDEFQRRAHHFLQPHAMPTDTLSWWALMQHHGAPTRLMDWTRSPFVASYFAFEDAPAEKTNAEVAIWCIDAEWCRRKSSDYLGPETHSQPIDFSTTDRFDTYILPGRHGIIVPVEPRQLHERIAIQQGGFMCAGDLDRPFLAVLKNLAGDVLSERLVKLILPAGEREHALDELHHMNINRASLFPGIDGLAQSLKYRFASLGSEKTALRKAIRGGHR